MTIYEKFYEFEKNNDLSKFSINGIWIYPILRLIVFNILFQQKNDRVKGNDINSCINWLKKLIRDIKWNLKNRKINQAEIFYCVEAITRRRRKDGLYENIYISPIVERLKGKKQIVLELPSEHINHYSPIPEKEVYYPDFDIDKIYFKARKKNTIPNFDVQNFDQLFNFFDVAFDERLLFDRLNKFFLLLNFFSRLLQKYDPKFVIVVNAYDYKKMALIHAAKQKHIPTIELQHGIIYKSHMAYIYPEIVNRDLLPDYLLTYGDYFSNLIRENSLAFETNKVISVGFPYLENVLNKSPDLPDNLVKISKEKFVILITSQWVIRDQLKNFVLRLESKLSSNFLIFYKIHPGEKDIEIVYKEFKNKKIILITDKAISSLELMKIAKIHTTIFSTSYFESLAFELPNILIEMDGYTENVKEFIDNKTTFLASSPQQYCSLLEQIFNNYEKVRNFVKSKSINYFSSNSLQNIKSVLQKIERDWFVNFENR